MIANADGQRPARPAFADDQRHHRHPQSREHQQIPGNRLALIPFFCPNSRVRPWCIDERNHRQFEAFRHLQQSQCLAIAFGPGHPKVAVQLLLGIAPFLMPDHHDRTPLESRDTGDDRGIVRVTAVAVQLFKLGEQGLDIVQRIGPLWMAGQLGYLPGAQVGEDLLGQRLAFGFESGDLFREIHR